MVRPVPKHPLFVNPNVNVSPAPNPFEEVSADPLSGRVETIDRRCDGSRRWVDPKDPGFNVLAHIISYRRPDAVRRLSARSGQSWTPQPAGREGTPRLCSGRNPEHRLRLLSEPRRPIGWLDHSEPVNIEEHVPLGHGDLPAFPVGPGQIGVGFHPAEADPAER